MIQYTTEWSQYYPIEVLCDTCGGTYFVESLYSSTEEPKIVFSNVKCRYCGSIAKTARLHLNTKDSKRGDPCPPNDPSVGKTLEWKVNREGNLIREVCIE